MLTADDALALVIAAPSPMWSLMLEEDVSMSRLRCQLSPGPERGEGGILFTAAMEFGFLLSTIIHHSFSRIAKGKISLTSTNQRPLFRSRDLSRPIRDSGQSKTKKIVKTFMMSAQLSVEG